LNLSGTVDSGGSSAAMLTVIGCGNPTRSDDGVGVFVAQALQAHLRAHARSDVRVFDAGTSGIEVMFQAVGTRRLILVDAARSGSPPGAIFKMPGAQLAAEHVPSFNLHDFRWDHALAAGQKIYRERFPTDVTVYLIEQQSCAFGLELSEPVRVSAARVIAEIQRAIDDYATDG
jgi:hydrogenase maturation protease